jgi:hypothetical protein
MSIMENKFTFLTISTSFLLGILVFISASKIPEATQTTYDTTSNIVFKWCVIGAKYPNELDTLNGSFAKDMVRARPVWTRLDLSQEELDIIYQRLVDIDFFSYPRFFYPTLEGDIRGASTPFSIYYLEYINETGAKIVQWDTKFSAPNDTRYKNLKELGYFIRDLILAKPEYQRLPEPKGGYA